MYSIKIRDHIMIAHSFNDKLFGPAQKLHGATYIVDVTFYSLQLNKQNIVVDITLAHEALHKTLAPLNYQNLDEMSQFHGKLTTTEFIAKYIHDQIKRELKSQFTGKVLVTLGESHIAWASYEGEDE
jgi:6-pyruvoyltetrahydropterin/6-carboxytetrahydropterin synthase